MNRSPRLQPLALAFALALICVPWVCHGNDVTARSGQRTDSRMRTTGYNADQVYRLRGYVGYQIDLEFEPGEVFVGLGAGDVEALAFAAQDNHLFIKPKAAKVRTNLTVLTTRRSYHFDYEVLSAAVPDAAEPELIYTLRFSYPSAPTASGALAESGAERELDRSSDALPANRDYWYCGSPALLPLAAFDDGVHTHLRFAPRSELPALFVRNDDGSESLLNFSVQQGEVVIHRVARQFVVRRGKLQGCIVNKSFGGIGHDLQSGTVTSEVERATRGRGP
jgi:type IV secretion system protein VirB9